MDEYDKSAVETYLSYLRTTQGWIKNTVLSFESNMDLTNLFNSERQKILIGMNKWRGKPGGEAIIAKLELWQATILSFYDENGKVWSESIKSNPFFTVETRPEGYKGDSNVIQTPEGNPKDKEPFIWEDALKAIRDSMARFKAELSQETYADLEEKINALEGQNVKIMTPHDHEIVARIDSALLALCHVNTGFDIEKLHAKIEAIHNAWRGFRIEDR